jgi:hypothetical protein
MLRKVPFLHGINLVPFDTPPSQTWEDTSPTVSRVTILEQHALWFKNDLAEYIDKLLTRETGGDKNTVVNVKYVRSSCNHAQSPLNDLGQLVKKTLAADPRVANISMTLCRDEFEKGDLQHGKLNYAVQVLSKTEPTLSFHEMVCKAFNSTYQPSIKIEGKKPGVASATTDSGAAAAIGLLGLMANTPSQSSQAHTTMSKPESGQKSAMMSPSKK